MSRVELRGVSKRYGKSDVLAVNDVSFVVEDSEFLAILGPSGCGKTTTMRMIAGLESADTGDIQLGGRIVNDLSPAERNVAMAFENYGLYPHWSVFGNIAYPLRLRKMPEEKVKSSVDRIADLLDIKDILSLKPSAISGGAKQRVGLARALVRRPEVFLLDEPMSHVDPDFRSQMRVELKRIQRELGGTFVYVTHDQLEAMAMADRILVMRDGVIQQIGTPHDVFNHPANEFVAGFVGEPPMNFLPARLNIDGPGARLALPNKGSVPVPSRYGKEPRVLKDSALKLGIRPHRIRIGAPSIGEGGVSGKIYVVEPLGDYAIVTVKLGESTVKVEIPGQFAGVRDQAVQLAFSAEDVVVFSAMGEVYAAEA